MDGEWTPVKNVGGVTLPPFGVCVPTGGIDAETGCLHVAVAAEDNDSTFLVVGVTSIAAGGTGNATVGPRVTVNCDAADGAPAVRQAWGVKAGSVTFRKNYSGVLIQGIGDGGIADAVRGPKPSSAFGWFARLTTTSGGKWRYFRLKKDATGAEVNDGIESPDYTAMPYTIDGVNLCNPVAGLRVWMIESKTTGYQEFLPTGYADGSPFPYTAAGAYLPGLVSTGWQGFAGRKYFRDSVAVRAFNPAMTVPILGNAGYYPAVDTLYSVSAGSLLVANLATIDAAGAAVGGNSYGGGVEIVPHPGDPVTNEGGGGDIFFAGRPSYAVNGPYVSGRYPTAGGGYGSIGIYADGIAIGDPSIGGTTIRGRISVGLYPTVEIDAPGEFWFKPHIATISRPIQRAEFRRAVVKNGMVVGDAVYGGPPDAGADPDPDNDFGARESVRNAVFPLAPTALDYDDFPIWSAVGKRWGGMGACLPGFYVLTGHFQNPGPSATFRLLWSAAGTGTVTAVSAGTTGFSVTNPTTTPTLGGTLGIANGGTNATTAAGAANNLLPPQTGAAGSFLSTDGTNVGWTNVISGGDW